MQQTNRLMLLASAPFLGAFIFLAATRLDINLDAPAARPEIAFNLQQSVQEMTTRLERSRTDAALTRSTIESHYKLYAKSAEEASRMAKIADNAAKRPAAIFDSRVATKLGGKLTRQTSGANVDLKLFTFLEDRYKGYALKVDLKSDKGMRMALGGDKVGGSETTLQAAKRHGAVAGINAGGFADEPRSGKRYPLSTTVLSGKYVYGFEPSFEDLAFIGLSSDRKLIGGRFHKQEDLDSLKPSFGATFVPVLLQDGRKQTIPEQWVSSPARAPRTVVGNFKNDQLLFIVTDGYDENGNSGATLAELQDKLLALGIKDAYNLDGGGSSSLVFDGQIINRPSDGKLRALPTNFLFFK